MAMERESLGMADNVRGRRGRETQIDRERGVERARERCRVRKDKRTSEGSVLAAERM
jgi:hypothetical protein